MSSSSSSSNDEADEPKEKRDHLESEDNGADQEKKVHSELQEAYSELEDNTVDQEKNDHFELEDNATDQEKFHLFGRQKPVHSALGGGKPADVILWRNKQVSGALLASATVIWLLFEWIGYRLITFICHSLILSLSTLFLWSNLSCFVHKSSNSFPEVTLSEDLCNNVALLLSKKLSRAISAFREVALGKDIKKFFYVLAALWFGSIIGSWFDFLTLVYAVFVMMFTMPLMYEKHEDQVDLYAQKAKSKLQKQYSSFDEKVLKKLPKVPFIDNK